MKRVLFLYNSHGIVITVDSLAPRWQTYYRSVLPRCLRNIDINGDMCQDLCVIDYFTKIFYKINDAKKNNLYTLVIQPFCVKLSFSETQNVQHAFCLAIS